MSCSYGQCGSNNSYPRLSAITASSPQSYDIASPNLDAETFTQDSPQVDYSLSATQSCDLSFDLSYTPDETDSVGSGFSIDPIIPGYQHAVL